MKAPARPKAPTKSSTTAKATAATAKPAAKATTTPAAPPAQTKPKAAAKAVTVPTKIAPKTPAAGAPSPKAPPAKAKSGAKAAKPAAPPVPEGPPPPKLVLAAATPQPASMRAPIPPPPSRNIVSPPPPHRPPQRPSVSPAVVAATAKVPPRPKEHFAAGDHVVYPTHGVGQVQGIETVEAAGYSLQVIVVTFEENRMTLRVPVNKASSSGLRKLAAGASMQQALDTLKGRARIKRTMWSRRAQEYEAKINSGDPLQIAEVVRDLHRNAGQPDQSFSERQIYEQALDRLAAEVAAIDSTDKQGAIDKILMYLGKADKGGAKADAEDKADDAED